MALSPCECSARSVSAAAMPLGKRSCSMLIICRFIGMAIVTPSTARKNTQASISGIGKGWPLSMHVGGEGRDQRAAGRVARRTGGGLHAVVFQDGHRGLGQADLVERGPDGVGEDAGGDGHAEAPAGLQPDVEIRQRQDAAQERAHQHGPPGQLEHACRRGPCRPARTTAARSPRASPESRPPATRSLPGRPDCRDRGDFVGHGFDFFSRGGSAAGVIGVLQAGHSRVGLTTTRRLHSTP